MAGESRKPRAFLNLEKIESDINDKLLNILVEEAPVGSFIINLGKGDSEGRIVYANPDFCDIFGHTEAECKAMPKAWGFIHPEDRKTLEETLNKLPVGGKVRREVRGLKSDGTVIHLDIIATINSFEEMPSIVGTVIDTTGRQLLEKEKEDFFAMVTHDLKGPLTTIIGYTELMLSKKERLDDDTTKMLDVVELSANKLSEMVDNFLTISRLESGNIKLQPEPEDITLILRELETSLYPVAIKEGIEFIADIPTLPAVSVDRRYFERAASNLLQNAFKFTPAGGKITLKAENQEGDIIVSVEDTGPGIPKEDTERIFDKYYRGATSTKGGVGLGLMIVNAVAKAHGGRVSVQSEPGKGSTFSIHLPLHLEKTSAKPNPSPDRLN
jgi:two-component system phosphate regulon sensor histidine kinase PhoR